MITFRWLIACILSVLVATVVFGCRPLSHSTSSEPVVVRFSFTVDEAVCDQVQGKRRPQFAIWLEDFSGEQVRTVCVTQKTAKGNWGNQTTRPISLPYWVARWNKETDTQGDPSAAQPALDAVTCATPQAKFASTFILPRGTRWQYFIEVNQSFDNNEHFPAAAADGRKDLHGNGPPSIVYTGRITAIPGRTSTPELLGRTDQFVPTTAIEKDLSGITTAPRLLKDICVACDNQPAMQDTPAGGKQE